MSKNLPPMSETYRSWLRKQDDAPMVHAFDVETYLITPGNPIPYMVCLSYASANGDVGVLLREDGLDWLERVLEAGDHVIAHNARFDLSVCAADRPSLLVAIFQAYKEGRIHDTGLRQKILDNAKGILKYVWDEENQKFKGQQYNLAYLCHRLLGKWRFNDKEGDVWRIRFSTLDGIPIEDWPEGALKYSLEDSIDALEIFMLQEHDHHTELLESEWSQCQADWALQLMSVWGSRTNAEDIAILKEELEEALEVQVEICRGYNLLYPKFNKGAWVWSRKMSLIYDLVEETYGKYSIRVPRTKGGDISTSRDTLKMREHLGGGAEPHPGMIAVAEFVRIGKLLSTYVPMLELGTMFSINPNYNCILETYRTSCSKPNIQNLPRDGGVRDCWIAREGYVYCFVDYDTLEMRTLAQICLWLFGKSKIAEAIEEGKDLHALFAASMMNISYEECLERLEADDEEVKESRQGSKIANYGASGGMGGSAFKEYARGFGTDISIEDANALMQGFRVQWPEMVDYFRWCSRLAESQDAELGINQYEFFVSGLIRGNIGYTQIANSGFQNLAAMGAKKALFDVAEACYVQKESPLYGCRPWLFAHDEIGCEVPYDGTEAGRVRASRATKELERLMVAAMERFVPDVSIGATGALCFRWLKGAKPVHRVIEGEKCIVPCMKEDKYYIEDFSRDAGEELAA